MAKIIPVTIKIWRATHTSGTKFYHVVRFISGTGHSFSIRHYGKIETFTGLGKIATGAIELDEQLQFSMVAGAQKISDKRSGGYRNDVAEQTVDHASTADAMSWARANFGKKAQDIARPILAGADWKEGDLIRSAVDVVQPHGIVSELPTHEQWGSW